MEITNTLSLKEARSLMLSKVKNSLLAKVENLPERYKDKTFDNFIVNENNKVVFEKIKNGAQSLLLTGRTGTGKTHLAIAKAKSLNAIEVGYSAMALEDTIMKKNDLEAKLDNIMYRTREHTSYLKNQILYYDVLLENSFYNLRAARIFFISAAGLIMRLNEIVFANQSKIGFIENLLKYDMIILDDLGAEKFTEATRQNLYYLIDEAYKKMKQIIVTTNFSIEQINEVEPRIASRLAEMGEIIKLNGEDFRLKTN